MSIVFVYITCPDRDTALTLARTAVDERLAACGNVIDGMTSVYRWEGAVREESETVLILKTRSELIDLLTARIVELHPYDTPCVAALPIQAGAVPFLEWIRRETDCD